MIKLMIATDNLLPRLDGISVFLNELIPRIQNDFDITVVGPDYGEYKYKYNAKIVKFKLFNVQLGDFYPSTINFKELIKQIKASDLVFCQALGPIGFLSTIFAKVFRKPVVRYNHSIEWELFANSQNIGFLKTPINTLTKLMSILIYGLSKLILVPSIEPAELLTMIGVRNPKKVVHLAIDEKQYKPPKDKEKAKQNIGIDKDSFVIGYAGRIAYEKNLITLYRAFMRLSKKFDNVKLLIAGGGLFEIEQLFDNKRNIIRVGPQENLAPFYQAMDVYVLPSLTETTSLTTMEAMATGLPVVVTPVGFMKEYIDDGVNGLFFPKKNSYVLYDKLKHLITNKSDREKLGKNARQTMIDEYTWDKTAKLISKHLQSVVSLHN
jgi:glycosyltransferase involved in cell wall biosynthesis